MSHITQAKRVVIKVGTSTLAYENGRLNLRRMEELCKVLCGLQNEGREVVLVSSGAVGVGMAKLGLHKHPEEIEQRQAVAAVGQCELMFMYDKFFGEYNHTVGQVLLTRDVVQNQVTRKNAENTFLTLLHLGIIPVVNENDSVATDELAGKNFGDNDTLSATVAVLSQADLLVILTDIDGLYDGNPRTNPQAKRIPYVYGITDKIKALAGGAGSDLGTGGMATKVSAAEIANRAGIPCVVLSGANPRDLYDLFDGTVLGTTFVPAQEKN
ncbi:MULTISPECIES: glutamate 5-kinase [Caproicibacterium]|jgi:glutamate 5-kinase|uniref:Glutamate 5-kinase n=1 Tax=Caproicibacterium lactatifermentans TaxID=2666138 RepID=A0ABX6PVB4_9FIRM|nr:glutamate 5-kinase [Caproicibacterium lactatifermentans]ARP51179.1 glutamate 5-kinase [Ruminococcaceae bacterium CPB6]MDD4806986.1 glutamate 5-kinase [Oscillospiraceae bacterium]QKO30178.1 glutamate 5-kinase [Caproicibacterium lactatifermentans]